MATHAILNPTRIAAQDVNSYNRSVLSGSDIDNGNVFTLVGQNAVAGQTEVWDAIWPTTGSVIGLWMANAPEVVVTVSGNNKFRGIDVDPRNFYTSASTVFDAFRLQPGDIILLSADAFASGTPASAFAQATVDSFKWTWTNDGSTYASVTTLKYVSTDYFSVGSGSAIGTSHVPAYKMRVVSN